MKQKQYPFVYVIISLSLPNNHIWSESLSKYTQQPASETAGSYVGNCELRQSTVKE